MTHTHTHAHTHTRTDAQTQTRLHYSRGRVHTHTHTYTRKRACSLHKRASSLHKRACSLYNSRPKNKHRHTRNRWTVMDRFPTPKTNIVTMMLYLTNRTKGCTQSSEQIYFDLPLGCMLLAHTFASELCEPVDGAKAEHFASDNVPGERVDGARAEHFASDNVPVALMCYWYWSHISSHFSNCSNLQMSQLAMPWANERHVVQRKALATNTND